mgnify:CR=1 FL=1
MSTDVKDQQIFVVDDDDAVRDSLEVLLEHKGFKVKTFASSKVFLDRIEDFDQRACLLLDIRMPGMDGIEVLGAVVRRKLQIAIVMITGHADVATAVKAMKTGAVDFIEKPFEAERIEVVARGQPQHRPPRGKAREEGAVALRDLFSDYRMRAQQNTRYIESDLAEAIRTHLPALLSGRHDCTGFAAGGNKEFLFGRNEPALQHYHSWVAKFAAKN